MISNAKLGFQHISAVNSLLFVLFTFLTLKLEYGKYELDKSISYALNFLTNSS